MTTYLIKVILCSGIFVLAYKLLLEKERMHVFNRFYLLFSLLISFAIPAITFTSAKTVFPISTEEILNSTLLQQKEIIAIVSPENSSNYNLPVWLIIYLAITIILFFRFILNLVKALSKARSQKNVPYKNAHIVLISEDLTPHSFLNYLFINADEYNRGNIENEILLHEYAHVQQKHSYDILLMEVVLTFFWFNPFLFFYKKAMRLNHEFLADEAVINISQNIPSYQYLLIDKANKNVAHNLTSQFNYSITKKRLLMMTKKTSLKNALCRQIAIIPVLAVSIFLFSTKTFSQNTVIAPKAIQPNIPSSQDGVSQELLDEYDQIVDKAKNEKGFPEHATFSEADKSRLQTIYTQMSKVQQAKQIVIFMSAPPPLPRSAPTQAQIESWKDSKIYGVWINSKRVSNSELNKYQHTDFAQLFVSKLAKNTVNYGKHYYQVNLMTKEAYETYYKEANDAKNKYLMGVRMHRKDKKGNDVEVVWMVS